MNLIKATAQPEGTTSEHACYQYVGYHILGAAAFRAANMFIYQQLSPYNHIYEV